MLLQFKFKNHKCFYDETLLDLVATQEKRHLETTFESNDINVLPVISIHGANASGKTGVLEALYFMFSIVKYSNSIDINDDLPVNPFIFNSKIENSEYEISVLIDDYEYRYGFEINKDMICDEWLFVKRNSTRAVQKTIFHRTKKKVDFGKEYKKYNNIWDLFKNQEYNKLLVLSSVALKDTDGIIRNLFEYISKFDIKLEGRLSNRINISFFNEENKLYDKFKTFLNVFDPCLLGIEVSEIEADGKKISIINGIHKSEDGNTMLLPMNRESQGTWKLFSIMPSILTNLENGGLLCIDELDTKLHPLLFRKIVNMYCDKEINKKNAQLIFTTHSTMLFNSEYLRRDELYITDKDEMGKSSLYSLSEFRNLRYDSDYEKRYLSGQFGGIPFEDK